MIETLNYIYVDLSANKNKLMKLILGVDEMYKMPMKLISSFDEEKRNVDEANVGC